MKHALLAISASALLLSILACSGSSKADQPLQSPEQALISMSGDWSGPMKLNSIDQSVDMNVNIDGQTFTMRSATDPDGTPTTLSLLVTHEGGKPTLDLVFVNPDGVESKQLCSYGLPSDTKTLNICCGTAPGAPRPASAAPCDAKSDMSLSLSRIVGEATPAPAADNAAPELDPNKLDQSRAALQGDWNVMVTVAQPPLSDQLSITIDGNTSTMRSMTDPDVPNTNETIQLGTNKGGDMLTVDFVSEGGDRQPCIAVSPAPAAIVMCCALEANSAHPESLECDQPGQVLMLFTRPE